MICEGDNMIGRVAMLTGHSVTT